MSHNPCLSCGGIFQLIVPDRREFDISLIYDYLITTYIDKKINNSSAINTKSYYYYSKNTK